jgi:hypothetical protein
MLAEQVEAVVAVRSMVLMLVKGAGVEEGVVLWRGRTMAELLVVVEELKEVPDLVKVVTEEVVPPAQDSQKAWVVEGEPMAQQGLILSSTLVAEVGACPQLSWLLMLASTQVVGVVSSSSPGDSG